MGKKNSIQRKEQKISILIAEDSPTQAQKLQYYLEEENYSVHWEDNGQKALKYLEFNLPSIIISDVIMPEMNGFEFCAALKKDTRLCNIPVILLTTLKDPQDVIKGLESGADNFITKPYEKDHLMSRIDYILTNQKLRNVTTSQGSSKLGMEIVFAGKKYFITSEKMQIIDLLFSTYEAVIQKNIELERLNSQLKTANENIRVLKGLIPICSHCKMSRNDDGFWEQVEVYISHHSEADFSHSLCPPCLTELYPDLYPTVQNTTDDAIDN